MGGEDSSVKYLFLTFNVNNDAGDVYGLGRLVVRLQGTPFKPASERNSLAILLK